jgi:Na+-driven multidrug efflux pump
LKLLEASHPATVYTNPLPSVVATQQSIKQVPANTHQYLQALNKPRRVRLKSVARVIAIAFPISWIFIAYFGYQIARNEIAVAGPLATLGELGLFLFFAFIWSVIGISTIRSVRRDRKLLAEGNLATAIVTHQERSGGKGRQSKI